LNSPSIRKYAVQFYNSLPKSYDKVDLQRLLDDMDHSAVCLFGDFHTLKQAQRGLLRLLRDYRLQHPERSIVLALEMFRTEDQPHLNAYAKGLISEEELLSKTAYVKNWGFPWDHYRGIIDFALENSIAFVGINTAAGGKDRMVKRDAHAAQIIRRINARDPDALVICLIGEFHLADGHLPRQLAEVTSERFAANRVLRVVTNVDEYYFREPYHHSSPNSEYLHLKRNFYCILNTPPWIKWQSFVLWEELRSVEAMRVDDLDEEGLEYLSEESIDLEYRLATMIKSLADFLKIPIQSLDLSRMTVYYQPDQETYDGMVEQYELSEEVMDIAVERTSLDGFYYIHDANAIVINEISLNNLAEIAGIYLFNSLNSKFYGKSVNPYYYRILEYAGGMIASKILNPRRKGLDIWQFKRFVAASARKRLIGHAKMKRESAKKLIVFHEWFSMRCLRDKSLKVPLLSVVQADFSYNFEVSCSMGRIIGYTLYTKVMRQAIHRDFVRDVFWQGFANKSDLTERFIMIYQTVMH